MAVATYTPTLSGSDLDELWKKEQLGVVTAFGFGVPEWNFFNKLKNVDTNWSTREITMELDLDDGYGVASIPEGGYEARPSSPTAATATLTWILLNKRFTISLTAKYIHDKRGTKAMLTDQLKWQSKKAVQAIRLKVGNYLYGFSTGILAHAAEDANATTHLTIDDMYGVAGLGATGSNRLATDLFTAGDYIGFINGGSFRSIKVPSAIAASNVLTHATDWSTTADGDYLVKVIVEGYNTGASQTVTVSGASTPVTFTATAVSGDDYAFHWAEDVSVSGSEYSAYVNEAHVIEFLEESITVPDLAAADKLQHDYNVILSDEEESWSPEHAYRLLETLRSIPQTTRSSYGQQTLDPSKWILTDDNIADDVTITAQVDAQTVRISSAAFTYASPRIATVDGKRGSFYSQRLHHALVRFVTDGGQDLTAVEAILTERFGVTTVVPDYATLTASTTAEQAGRFQAFHATELVAIINMFEEMPEGVRIIGNLDYLVRRLDGTAHPLYADAPAVAWPFWSVTSTSTA